MGVIDMKRRRRFLNKGRRYSGINKDDKKMSKKTRIIIEAAIYLVEILLVIGIAYFGINNCLVKCTMVGDSMQPALENNDKVLINKLVYKLTGPKRNDVVAYNLSSGHSNFAIKRVIGLPGERIQIKDGKVYINGEVLKEDIEVEDMKTGGLAEEEITLEDNEYFVLGDNRNNSEDSRFSEIGTIVKQQIIGKVWLELDSYNIVR